VLQIPIPVYFRTAIPVLFCSEEVFYTSVSVDWAQSALAFL